MFKTNCGRLRQIALSDLSVHVAREGVVIEGRGLIKGDDLLSPQGTVFFEWKSWPPKIMGMVRDLMVEAEKHVAAATSTGSVEDVAGEPANVTAERELRDKELAGFQPKVPSPPVPGGAPLPPDLFEDDAEEGDDIASSLKVDSQF